MTGHPQLSIGHMNQLPPLLFSFHIRSLEVRQEQLLLAESEKVFQVESVRIGLIDVTKSQSMPLFTHDQQP